MRILFATIIAALPLFASTAQSKHQFTFGHGLATHAFIKEEIDENTEYDIDYYPSSDRPVTYRDNNLSGSSGCISFSYGYDVNRFWNLGIDCGFQRLNLHQERETVTRNEDGVGSNAYNYEYICGDVKGNVISILPQAKLYWFRKPYVGTYCKFGTGMYIRTDHFKSNDDDTKDKETTRHFAFQISPIGIEVGGPEWKGFIELGYGIHGLLMGGIKYSLPEKKKQDK